MLSEEVRSLSAPTVVRGTDPSSLERTKTAGASRVPITNGSPEKLPAWLYLCVPSPSMSVAVLLVKRRQTVRDLVLHEAGVDDLTGTQHRSHVGCELVDVRAWTMGIPERADGSLLH